MEGHHFFVGENSVKGGITQSFGSNESGKTESGFGSGVSALAINLNYLMNRLLQRRSIGWKIYLWRREFYWWRGTFWEYRGRRIFFRR